MDLEAIGSAYFGMKRPLRSAITRNTPSRTTCSTCPLSWPRATTIFIQIINIFKNMYYKYFQELNKFMFENTKGI